MLSFVSNRCFQFFLASSNAEAGTPPERCLEVTKVLLREVMHALHSPHQFKPYHQAIREPFDYYKVLLIRFCYLTFYNVIIEF